MNIHCESLSARGILREFKKCSITHIVWLAGSETRFMYKSMIRQRDFTLVPVCREGEAIAVAAGLIFGGKEPVVMHPNTGLFEAGDSIRGLALDLNLPLLLVIGYRGWQRHTPITDSAAIFTEPILNAWGIRHYLVETN